MSGPTPLRIGALVPFSRMFPGIDRDFLLGLRAGLSESDIEYELAIEPVGNGAVEDVVVDRVQRLLLQHRPHVVTGIIGAIMLGRVTSSFRDAEVPFVVNNLGADPLLDGGDPNPWILHNSFSLWQSMYALGHWAAGALGSRACVAAGFHEAGYGIVTAFWQGFVEAGGGTVLRSVITHRDSADDDPSAAVEEIVAEKPDFVVGLYSGREGVSFLRAYVDQGCTQEVPLVSSPLMLHERWLTGMGAGARGVRTAFAWDRKGESDAHERFLESCRAVDDRPPDLFALLGYETGLLLGGAAVDPGVGRCTLETLSEHSFPSPRGRWSLDPAGRHVVTTDRLFEVRPADDGEVRLVALEALDLPDRYRTDYDTFRRQELRPGWINPYLVT